MRSPRLLSFAAVPLMLLTATGAATAAEPEVVADGYEPTVTSTACPPLGNLEVEGQTVECGTVSVPIDYSDPDAGVYELAFANFKSRSLAPYADPVIYLEGGPGVASLETLADPYGVGSAQDGRFDELRRDRDVVWFDQRSTGLSTGPLDCSDEIIGALTGLAESASEGIDGAEAQQIAVSDAVLQACLTVFEERGADISQINTENNARDVDLLARALGYDDFNLFGISYGTRLALEVMRQAPEGLRSVVLDSVSAPDVPGYAEDGIPFDEAVGQLFAMCEADEACAAAYPDLRARFQTLLDQLEEEPVVVGDTSVGTDEVLDILDRRNYQGGISAYVPQMIGELEQGVVDTYVGLTSGELPPAPLPESSALQQAIFGRLAELPYGSVVAAQSSARVYDKGTELQDEATRTWASLLSNAEAPQPTLAQQFDDVVTDALGSAISRYVLDDDTVLAYLALPLGETTPEALITFADEYASGLQRDELTALASAMSVDEIEELFGIIHGESLAVTRDTAAVVSTLYYICNENIPFNSVAGFDTSRSRYEFQQVADAMEDPIKLVLGTCDDYPDTWQEAADFHTPVTSDVPTLVFVGNNDTQTAFSSGERVRRTLDNGQLVQFPDTGHGAIENGGQCAQDIALAFVNAPATAVDPSCVAALQPQWALPVEDALE